MRVSRDVAARNRERVVEAAGRQFRKHGYDGIGLTGLMKAAGLTHGGFYKQFDDKEALSVEATEQALTENLAKWREVLESTAGDPLDALRRWYLSVAHLTARGEGCAYAALASEAPRHGKALRRAFEGALERSVQAVCERAPAAGRQLNRAEALRAISLIVGSLILARAVESPALKEEVLASGRAGT